MADIDEDNVVALAEGNALPVERGNVMNVAIPAYLNLNDLLQNTEEAEVITMVHSVAFDSGAQDFMKLLLTLIDTQKRFNRAGGVNESKFGNLSKTFKKKYPELVNHYKNWKPCREELIRILNKSSQNLEKCSTYTSAFRILTSAADILGTTLLNKGESTFSLPKLLMENASTYGIFALVFEKIISKKIHKDVKNAIVKDQDLFENITQWFGQTKELDKAIRNFFPYGIDKELVKKIHANADNLKDYHQLFMSILASNVQQDVKLFKDTEFLHNAGRVASSEVGKVWFYKVILENDPCVVHCLNSTLCEEIQELQVRVSPIENREMCVDAVRLLSNTVKMKVILNLMTIISAGSNIWLGDRPEEANTFQKLSDKTKNELKQIRNIIRLLKPADFSDGILEDN